MIIKANILIILILCSVQSYAAVCWNSKGKGVTDAVTYDLSNSFNATNNKKGGNAELRRNFTSQVYVTCPPDSRGVNYTLRSYVTTLPIVEVVDNYKYLQLNEYLLGTMRITDSVAGQFYPPQNYVKMGETSLVSQGKSFPIWDSNFTFRLKVIKPFINFVTIPQKTLFVVYVTTSNADPLSIPVYTISYSGSINVPQTCQLDANRIVEIDFGKITANDFLSAGKGNKPKGVNKQTRNISIQCNNVEVQAALTLRLEVERSDQDIILSNNPAIGFKISDQNDKILIPNNIKSYILFKLERPSIVTIKAWPVSANGLLPEPGPFRSNGYLRVDYE